jgi:hypothetical protein
VGRRVAIQGRKRLECAPHPAAAAADGGGKQSRRRLSYLEIIISLRRNYLALATFPSRDSRAAKKRRVLSVGQVNSRLACTCAASRRRDFDSCRWGTLGILLDNAGKRRDFLVGIVNIGPVVIGGQQKCGGEHAAIPWVGAGNAGSYPVFCWKRCMWWVSLRMTRQKLNVESQR